jgi:HK97 gp10 family phage protein
MALRARTLLRGGESVSVEGFSDLHAALKELSRATERNVLKRAVKKAGQPILEAAQSHAPVKTGQLRDSIRLTVGFDDPDFRRRARAAFSATGSARGVKRTKGGGNVLAQVRAGGNLAPYASLIELGSVRITAHPFLRPAFDEQSSDALALLKETLGVEVRKATARRARRLAKAKG